MPTPDLSIILPIHNERDNIVPLLDEIQAAVFGKRWQVEVIAVDDGSTDDSPTILRRLAAENPWLRVILFRRNYGQSAAFDAGFRAARGALVVTMDADRQNDPADIPRMIDLMEREDCDFVAGRRANRKDGFVLRKLPSKIANFIIRRVTRTKIQDLGCSLKLYRRDVVMDLNLYGEMHRFIAVLVEGLGARTRELDVHHRPRVAGVSKYGLSRTVKVMLDLLTVWFMRGYQTKPIYIFGGLGLLLGVISVLVTGVVAYQKWVEDVFVHRNPLFIIAVIMAVIGVQFLVLGLLAEILVRTYFESGERTSYTIRARINFPSESIAPPLGLTQEPKPAQRQPADTAR